MNTQGNMPLFQYSEAFSRNIGLLTVEEQEQLRSFTIAIPGMGGVGGAHLISLVRQGFERFKIADYDLIELKNFNRQYAARMGNIGKKKVSVMKEDALAINPNCQIEIFDEAVTSENIDQFLTGVDMGIDGIDAFQIDARRMFFMNAHARGIPVITAGPVGFSTALLIFMPQGPTFDQYFAITDSMSYIEKRNAFFVGLVPKLLQRKYMRGMSLDEKRGPSSIGAINLCTAVATINVLKILLKRGTVKAVPYFHQFDAMENRYVVKRLWFGNYNPIQQIKMKLIKYMVAD